MDISGKNCDLTNINDGFQWDLSLIYDIINLGKL